LQLFFSLCWNALPPNSRTPANLCDPILHAFNSLALTPQALDSIALDSMALASLALASLALDSLALDPLALVCVYGCVRILVVKLCLYFFLSSLNLFPRFPCHILIWITLPKHQVFDRLTMLSLIVPALYNRSNDTVFFSSNYLRYWMLRG